MPLENNSEQTGVEVRMRCGEEASERHSRERITSAHEGFLGGQAFSDRTAQEVVVEWLSHCAASRCGGRAPSQSWQATGRAQWKHLPLERSRTQGGLTESRGCGCPDLEGEGEGSDVRAAADSAESLVGTTPALLPQVRLAVEELNLGMGHSSSWILVRPINMSSCVSHKKRILIEPK